MTTTQPQQELSVSSTDELRSLARQSLENCGVELTTPTSGPSVSARSPITGEALFDVPAAGRAEVEAAIAAARAAFLEWRTTPAPVRGALVKRLGVLLTEHKSDVAELVTIEAGKIPSEALGEVQEMIDICDFAVGLSRQLYGLTIASERPGHRMMETWHPLGVCGVISAFNFPVAVWSWNAALAFVCGDPVVWKPSEKTPLCALAVGKVFQRATARFGEAPADLLQIVVGEREAGENAASLVDQRVVRRKHDHTCPSSANRAPLRVSSSAWNGMVSCGMKPLAGSFPAATSSTTATADAAVVHEIARHSRPLMYSGW